MIVESIIDLKIEIKDDLIIISSEKALYILNKKINEY